MRWLAVRGGWPDVSGDCPQGVLLTHHGYGLLDVRPDHVTAEFWYVPLTHLDDRATFARGLVVHQGTNRWERRPTTRPTVPVALHQRVSTRRQEQESNPRGP